MGNCMSTFTPLKSINSNPNSATNVKSSNQSIPTQRTDDETLSTPGLKAFTCNDFATGIEYSHSLTEGGEYSDIVFKGWIDKQTLCPSIPEPGIPVSLKHLKSEGFKGDKEWLKKLNYIGQLHHPNLVKLIGYRVDSEDWFLVYEFLPNGSLENYLFREGIQPISWETRMKVAIGAAKGLSFLHDAESQVLYRYLDASNILLDDDFNVKLPTYLAPQVMDIQGYARQGYVAQGYAASESVDTVYGPGCVSTKSDVYSYGILLLVLLTGRCALKKSMIGDQYLLNWVKLFRRKLLQIMDTKLEGQYPENVAVAVAAVAVAALALQCTDSNPNSRPEMSQVSEKLQEAVSL